MAKAGLVASLPARTSIIAAANPVGGHFDRGKTVQVGHGRAGWKVTCTAAALYLHGLVVYCCRNRFLTRMDCCQSRCCCIVLLQENLRLSPAMLSRFDVIFVLLDRPDELMDQALSEHIMALHSGKYGPDTDRKSCQHLSLGMFMTIIVLMTVRFALSSNRPTHG